jgi:hypothetical protein
MPPKTEDALGKDSPIGKLVTLALHQLKGNEDLEYEYIICDAKPTPAMMIAKKISPKHKEMLTEATDCKKFLHPGICYFEEGHVVFEPETPSSSVLPKIKLALQQHTGKKHAVRIPDDPGDGEAPPAAPEAGGTALGAAKAGVAAVTELKPVPELVKAPQVWKLTCDTILGDIKGLGKAVQAQCSDEPADFTKEINGSLKKLESRIESFGLKLAQSLAKANEAKDAAARKAELTNAKAIMARTIQEAKPLAAVVDENPFVKTNFTGQLTTGLTQVAQAITRGLAA